MTGRKSWVQGSVTQSLNHKADVTVPFAHKGYLSGAESLAYEHIINSAIQHFRCHE